MLQVYCRMVSLDNGTSMKLKYPNYAFILDLRSIVQVLAGHLIVHSRIHLFVCSQGIYSLEMIPIKVSCFLAKLWPSACALEDRREEIRMARMRQ